MEFHNLNAADGYGADYEPRREIRKNSFPRGRAYFATTTRDQKAEVDALKKAGFRRIGSWRNGNTGRKVTMWVKNVSRL